MALQSIEQHSPGQPGFEEHAWTLFEVTEADQLFVYRSNAVDTPLDPVLVLGSLSLQEKQRFWTSQFDPATDPLAGKLTGSPIEVGADSTLRQKNGNTSLLCGLRAPRLVVYPLQNHGQLLGLALVGWLTPDAALSEAHARLARIITRSMTLEIENARLYEQNYQQQLQEAMAAEITQAILRRDELSEIMRHIATEGLKAVDALGCSIRRLDDEGRLQPVVAVGQPIPSPLQATASGRSPEVLRRQRSPSVFMPEEPSSVPGEQTVVLSVPLRSNQQTIGFLELLEVEAYAQPQDRTAAQSIANQAAVALEVSTLYQRVQQTVASEERARLARDLHDSISQSLYAMRLYTRAAQRQLAEGNQAAVEQNLQALNRSVRELQGELRAFIFELRPMALQRYGLKGLLEQRLQSVEDRCGLQTELDIDLPDPMPAAVEENLYHIALEALNNTVKHAQADQVWVSIRQPNPPAGTVHLTVRDDGIGFEPETHSNGGVGLSSIRERVESLHGRLAIRSAPGVGVTISIEVPYE